MEAQLLLTELNKITSQLWMHLQQTLEESIPEQVIGRKTALIKKKKEQLALKAQDI